MQPSKSVASASTSAPAASGWTSCAVEILPAGRMTTARMFAAAAYAASAAEVSPVDAHAIARIGLPAATIAWTCETSTVMPRSLNDPECDVPHCLTRRSPSPRSFANRGIGVRCEQPSPNVMTCARGRFGATHSRLPHTPLVNGSSRERQRLSNSAFQSVALRVRSAARSWWTSSRSWQRGQR